MGREADKSETKGISHEMRINGGCAAFNSVVRIREEREINRG